jgi:hypothetical protein
LIPAPGKSAEEVAALTFAPPQVSRTAEALPETKPTIANPLPQSDNAAKPDVSSSAASKPDIAKEVQPKEKAVAKAKRKAQPRIERPDEAIQTQEREQADQARQVERKRQVKEPRERRRVLVAERRRQIVERKDADDVSERTLFMDREPRRGGLFGGIFGFGD